MPQRKTIHRSRHLHIAEDDVHRKLGPREDHHSLVGAGCLDDAIPARAQVIGNDEADEDLVLDDENRLHTLHLILLDAHGNNNRWATTRFHPRRTVSEPSAQHSRTCPQALLERRESCTSEQTRPATSE